MEIEGSRYKEGPTAAKCILGVILLLCFIYMSNSCNYRHPALTFYMGPEPEVNLGSQYYEGGNYQEAADYYQEKVDQAIPHSVTACRLLETSKFPANNYREDLEQFKEQLKGYYQTAARDMTDKGFELWYQEQMDSQ